MIGESFYIDRFGSNVEQVVTGINIPYSYLPVELREEIRWVVYEVVVPNLQNLLREGQLGNVLAEQIRVERQVFQPELVSPAEYLRITRQTYVEKIALQVKMADLINDLTVGNLDNIEFKRKAFHLLAHSSKIEARYFALGSQVKQYVDYCIEKMDLGNRSCLSDEDIDLLTSPGLPSFFLVFEMDIAEYFMADETEKVPIFLKLVKKYFNNDDYFAHRTLEDLAQRFGRLGDADRKKIDDTRDKLKARWIRKVYLLLERKIPFAEELDEILVYDNCFDKYLESKLCFIHDLFFKICLIDISGGRRPLSIDALNIRERVKEALFTSDDRLLKNSLDL